MPLVRIHRFSKLTGLSPHVIRAWEKRYGLVTPTRGENRYRLYTDEDVVLFRHLKKETLRGVPIGELAELGREALLRQIKQVQAKEPRQILPSESLISELCSAVQRHDWEEFEKKLNGAVAVVPFEESLLMFLLPLQEKIGQLWHDGKITVAQEHWVTQKIQQKISSAMNQLRMPELGPRVVVCCPSKEMHEIGAQVVAYWCLARGFRTFYLGADLPLPELGRYCSEVQPVATLISVSIPLVNPKEFIDDLKKHVNPYSSVCVGGYGAVQAKSLFEQEGVKVIVDLFELEGFLQSLQVNGISS